MAEYLIKFKVTIDSGLFPKYIEGSDIYEGDTAKAAKEKALSELKAETRAYEDEVSFMVTDITKL